jgi:hypothetical protein
MADASCRHCPTEQLVDLVLGSANERLRARCDRQKILDVLAERHAAYDVHSVCSLLARKYDTVEEQLEEAGAAPSSFLAILWPLVQPSESTAAAAETGSAGSSQQGPPTEEAPPNASASRQASLGSFFAKGTMKTYERLQSGQRVLASVTDMSEEQLQAQPASTAGFCVKGCGRSFSHAPAKVAHEKVCKGGINPFVNAAAAAAQAEAAEAAAASVSAAAAASFSAAASAAAAAAESDDEVRPPPGKAPKLRKDGKPKQSGQREGELRTPRTLYFKLEVVKTFRHFERLKVLSLCSYPNQSTCGVYKTILPSDVTKYVAMEEQLRNELTHEHRVKQKHKDRLGKMATFRSRGARRVSLHRGDEPAFAAAREELHRMYREKRARGERVTGPWLRISMKRLVRKYYGDDAADGFKATKGWLRNFACDYNISLRRKSNNKSEPIEVRLPKIKRWHARLRRRLKRGATIDPVYGRWLPRNRLSHDQVGCNLRAGLQNTYNEKGAKRVWIAGGKADDGKRFCTFNISARAVCIEGKPRRGQPKMSVIFKGQGKKISAQERAGWHPNVHVRFQKKAWADDALCEEVAGEEIAEATEEARARGERSVVFFDNLSGQTTLEHKRKLNRKAKADRHLLPTNTTGELMHVDDGIGAAFKNRLGVEMDTYLEGDGNLESWVAGPKEGGLKAWEKRVLVTNLAAAAWDKLCATYDFEASALRLGLLMTIDGSNDDKIKPQGLGETYSFTDAEGGSAGGESEPDQEEEEDIAAVSHHKRPNSH